MKKLVLYDICGFPQKAWSDTYYTLHLENGKKVKGAPIFLSYGNLLAEIRSYTKRVVKEVKPPTTFEVEQLSFFEDIKFELSITPNEYVFRRQGDFPKKSPEIYIKDRVITQGKVEEIILDLLVTLGYIKDWKEVEVIWELP